jgi:hypothetical protein
MKNFKKFPKKSKYKNKKCFVGNIKFDSKKERGRYLILKDRLRKGEIQDLILQPVFVLQENFKYKGKTERKITYKSDFQYFDLLLQKTVVEDAKGCRTDVYKIKRKMFLLKYPEYEFIES